MTRLAHLRQLHQQALERDVHDAMASGDNCNSVTLRDYELVSQALNALPYLLDIAEAAQQIHYYGLPTTDPRTKEQHRRMNEALNRLEQQP